MSHENNESAHQPAEPCRPIVAIAYCCLDKVCYIQFPCAQYHDSGKSMVEQTGVCLT